MSPSRCRRCIRTRVGFSSGRTRPCSSRSPTPPTHSATCGKGSTADRNAIRLNSPKGVRIGVPPAGSIRRTRLSRPNLCATTCATEQILIACRAARVSRSGIRAISPSSRMISMITAAGCSPANRHRSSDPSVCPVRTSTPPVRDRSGLICPGRTKSPGPDAGSIASRMDLARSRAETPVVKPCLGCPSIETVNGVPRAEVFTPVCGCRSRRSQSSGVSERHMYPRATESMNVIASGVTNSAGRIKSPSFSRCSSSVRITIRPARSSSSTSGMVVSGIGRS